ncbi:MAG: hypothetical protein EKK46_06020 [Rhodocyclaceae bacterium]|nr:MAG: hypothetical protein EKK46_06020 [Rhodocyclaceae bacterium]
MARSSSSQAEFVRDLSQPDGLSTHWSAKTDSVLGLQANFPAAENLEAVAQAVSRYRYDGSHDPELTWAFLKFEPNPNLSLRGGRLGTEFYMLADSRLVGYSYLPIRPPNDYYGALPFSYIDGADGLATLPLGEGLLRSKLFAGLIREKAPLANRQWDMNRSVMSGAYVDYQQGAWQWRLGYAQVKFKKDLPLADLHQLLELNGAMDASKALSMADKLSRFYSAGAVYDSGPLQVQLMLSRTQHDSKVFENSHAGYLIAGYRLNKVTPFAGFSWTRSSSKQLSTGLGPVMDATVAGIMADSHSDQHTATLGLRWDFRQDMALKAQLDAVRGSPRSIFPTRWEQPNYNGRLNIVSLALDFVF